MKLIAFGSLIIPKKNTFLAKLFPLILRDMCKSLGIESAAMVGNIHTSNK